MFEIALIGPARMYVGAHWFSDVIGALLLAGIYLALAWKLDGIVGHIRALDDERHLAADAGLSGVTWGEARIANPRTATPGPFRDEPQAAHQEVR